MSCQICGAERSAYRERSRMRLCVGCHKDTPTKSDRGTFDRQDWGAAWQTVPEAIRREFYDDYRHSTYGPVKDYVAATTADA